MTTTTSATIGNRKVWPRDHTPCPSVRFSGEGEIRFEGRKKRRFARSRERYLLRIHEETKGEKKRPRIRETIRDMFGKKSIGRGSSRAEDLLIRCNVNTEFRRFPVLTQIYFL